MATTIEQLLKTPPRKLIEELEAVRERERQLAQERELLERVLEILAENSGPGRKAGGREAPITIGPLRKQIIRVMRLGKPNQKWIPKQVQNELVAHGNKQVSLPNVRMTMGRMAEAGELVRPNPRSKVTYALPPDED